MIASSILFSVRSLAIVNAVKTGALTEPFSKGTFRPACSGFGDATYNSFLDKHSLGNPGGNSELFERVSPCLFICLRPFRHGL